MHEILLTLLIIYWFLIAAITVAAAVTIPYGAARIVAGWSRNHTTRKTNRTLLWTAAAGIIILMASAITGAACMVGMA